MSDDDSGDAADAFRIAATLLTSVGLLVKRVRQAPVAGDALTTPERQALSRLDRMGPSICSALAREAQITAQAMGATAAALQARGLIERRADPADGRRVVLSVTDAGRHMLQETRDAKSELIAQALSRTFTRAELEQLAAVAPLLERLAQHI